MTTDDDHLQRIVATPFKDNPNLHSITVDLEGPESQTSDMRVKSGKNIFPSESVSANYVAT